ncbi:MULTISPECIES: hypothetical protein [unclassified Sphingopyxis]|jgi:uncharacterized membrane protein YjjP (DUF1212 family)|uniref:hypothetical protein n=1 Tax=unclassified Sphingopyxis TaxID=2614943 RepID=UPI000DC61C0E|nr:MULTISPECIES: hypothetical protein [unclassified Sphingopyxis]BBB08313.1 hypothetical protein SPYCW_1329 [Sphingopyxis sp. EG6]HEV7340105.1 hypothetical protein [Sphingopyxis sp.]
MLRELAILVLVLAGFASAVAAYLAAFHGEVTIKEVVSTAFAATLGMYVGRYIERGLARG